MGADSVCRVQRGNFDGITYLNTFFIKRDELRNETIHFHELIHVVQWRILDPNNSFGRMQTAWSALDIAIVQWR